MRRSVAVSGPRDPADVWDRYARPARWPEWSPQIRSVDHPGDRLYAGATGVVHGMFGVRVPYTVHAVDETARRWSWTAGALGVHLTLLHTVETTPTGSRTTLTTTGPAPAVLAYLPLALLALRRLVR